MKIKIKEILNVFNNILPQTPEIYNLLEYEIDEEEMTQAFSLTLKTVRNYKNISLNALSKEVDIPNPSISRYENGLVVPTIAQAVKLTAYFGLSVELFIFLGIAGLKGGNIANLYEQFVGIINGNKPQNRAQRRAQKRVKK